MKKRSILATVLIFALGVHVVALIVAGTIMILVEEVEEPPSFEALPVTIVLPKQELVKTNIKKLTNKSSPPRPQTITVHNPNDIELPMLNIPRINTAIAITGRSSGGFGVGIEGGGGKPSLGIDASFFGTKSSGENIAFVLDLSNSMNQGDRSQVMRREVVRTLGELPDDTNVAIVCFAGPAWDISNRYNKNNPESYVYESQDGLSEYNVTKTQWVTLTTATRRELQNQIKNMKLVDGTAFAPAFHMAMQLDPLPETIFFMTDGACNKNSGISAITNIWLETKKAHRTTKMPKINAVGLELLKPRERPEDNDKAQHLIEIAELGRGKAVFLDGASYIEEYGKDSSFDWSQFVKREKPEKQGD